MRRRTSLFTKVGLLILAGAAVALAILVVVGSLLYDADERPRFLVRRYVHDATALLRREIAPATSHEALLDFNRRFPGVEVAVWKDGMALHSTVSEAVQPADFAARGTPLATGSLMLRGMRRVYALADLGDRQVVFGYDLVPPPAFLAKSMVLILALVAGIFLLLYGFLRRILSPVRDLVGATQELRQGNLRFRLTPTSADEFAELTRSFNAMADRLEASFTNQSLVIGHLAHDLKAYLARLRLMAEMDLPAGPSREAFAGELQGMTSFLERTLEAFRQGSGTAGYEFRVEPFGELVGAAVRGQPVGEVTLRVPPGPGPAARVDRTACRLMLDNLVGNALRYGESVTVTLETAEGGRFRLEVRNRMRNPVLAEDLPLLSQPFFRPGGARTPGSGGAGLGLFIARQVAEAHGFTFRIALEGDSFAVEVTGPIEPESRPQGQ